MHVSVVGINHQTASVEVRERFAFSAEELPGALARLGREFSGAVILSTCNRTEVYVTAPRPLRDPWPVLGVLIELKGQCGRYIDSFYTLACGEAVRHLFRVAAGLDSMVLGEAEILGQVRSAFAAATAAKTSNRVISHLFHSAIRIGRRARSETHICRRPVSVSSTAVALARQILGDLTSRSVLVVSAGEAGKLTARSLVESGASNLRVTSRTYQRALELAADLGGTAVPFDDLAAALADSDIVIASSGAPSFVIGPEMVKAAAGHRDGRPLLLIDIAVPRDVDPAVRELPNVHLYDIDDLRNVSEQNLGARRREAARVEGLIEAEVGRFAEWQRSLEVVPIVAALKERAEAVRAEELARTIGRLNGLSEEERRRVDAMSAAIVKKLLHAPITRLKTTHNGERYAAALRELFDLDGPAPGS